MPVVIDGNNLLYAARAAEADGLLTGRSMLCDAVGRWAELFGQTVHVVFDGPAPNRALASQIGHPAIRVSYSGPGVSADSVLAELIHADSAARRLIVVSSDRGVARVARQRRARPMRSEDFWARLRRSLARAAQPPAEPPEPEEKEVGLSPEAAADWLAEFGLDDGSKDSTRPGTSRPDGPGEVS